MHYDVWHTCVLTGCPDFPQANEAHSFPYLATFVSVLFLFGIMMAWQLMAQLGAISASLDSVRTDSKSKKKPPTTSSDGHESRRWREGAAAPRDRDSPRRPEGDDGDPGQAGAGGRRIRILGDLSGLAVGVGPGSARPSAGSTRTRGAGATRPRPDAVDDAW